MKKQHKDILVIVSVATVIAAGVVWASNNVDFVEDVIEGTTMQGKIVPLMRQLKNTSSVDYNDTATIKLDHSVYHVLELETNLTRRQKNG